MYEMNDSFLVGNYVVNKKRIGKGAFSSVYLGKSPKNELVAIKKIEIDNIKKITSRIRAEIEICKKLKHPNILETYDVIYDTSGGNIYIITEYCSKGDLSQFLKSRALKEKYVQHFMKQIVDGIKYLLNNQIMHRDLKPHNILLNDKGELKIADFGFARHFENDGMVETLCGTPLYMAPEIMKKQKYTVKSDLWSIGIIMYQMLFGRRPYDANNIFDLMNKIENKKLNLIDYNVSSESKDLIIKLLKINPDNRISWDDFFNHPWFLLDLSKSVNNSNEEQKENKQDIQTQDIQTQDEIKIKTEEIKRESEENQENKKSLLLSKIKSFFTNKKNVKDNISKNNEIKQNIDNILNNTNINIDNITKINNVDNITNFNNINNKTKYDNVENITKYNNINNINNNITKNNENKNERIASKPIPIMKNNNNFINNTRSYNNNSNVNSNNNSYNINENRLTKQSPMFIENSSSNDYIILSNDSIKIIKKEDRDNYMEQEDNSSDEDDELYQRPHSVKNYFNDSINYLRNSMEYFHIYKNSSL